jgi:hypothetical protein
VRDYAFERLTSGPPPTENETALIDLAFVEDTDHWTIRRCLEQLASASPGNTERARSLWRWFFLDEVVTEMERQRGARTAEDSPHYSYWHDEFLSDFYFDLCAFWEKFPFPAGEFSIPGDDWDTLCTNTQKETGADLLDECRRWLARERERLIEGGSPQVRGL